MNIIPSQLNPLILETLISNRVRAKGYWLDLEFETIGFIEKSEDLVTSLFERIVAIGGTDYPCLGIISSIYSWQRK